MSRLQIAAALLCIAVILGLPVANLLLAAPAVSVWLVTETGQLRRIQ